VGKPTKEVPNVPASGYSATVPAPEGVPGGMYEGFPGYLEPPQRGQGPTFIQARASSPGISHVAYQGFPGYLEPSEMGQGAYCDQMQAAAPEISYAEAALAGVRAADIQGEAVRPEGRGASPEISYAEAALAGIRAADPQDEAVRWADLAVAAGTSVEDLVQFSYQSERRGEGASPLLAFLASYSGVS
jgi:hypothetical protein